MKFPPQYIVFQNKICLNRELEQNLKTDGGSIEPLVKLQVKQNN